LVQLVFNWSQLTVSSSVAYGAYVLVVARVLHAPGPLALLVAAITHFGCNTAAMSTIIGLTEDKPIPKVWRTLCERPRQTPFRRRWISPGLPGVWPGQPGRIPGFRGP